jgi:hypothetical protein
MYQQNKIPYQTNNPAKFQPESLKTPANPTVNKTKFNDRKCQTEG